MYFFNEVPALLWAGQRLATAWRVRGSNPGGGEIFRTCPDRPWGPPSLLGSGYQVFPGVNSGRGVTLTLYPFQCRGHERVQLYLYSLYGPYGLYRDSVPVQGCTLPYFTFFTCTLRRHSCLHTCRQIHYQLYHQHDEAPTHCVDVLKWAALCIQAESGHFETLVVNTL